MVTEINNIKDELFNLENKAEKLQEDFQKEMYLISIRAYELSNQLIKLKCDIKH